MINVKMRINEIDLSITEIKKSIANFKSVDLDSDDFYRKMLTLTSEHPEAYEIIQAMVMLFSKTETSNKQFKEHVVNYSVQGLSIKTNTFHMVQELISEIERIDETVVELKEQLGKQEKEIETINNQINPKPKEDSSSDKGIIKSVFKFLTTSKEAGKIVIISLVAIIFFTIVALEACCPDTLHSVINNAVSASKGEKIETVKTIHDKKDKS